MLEQFNFRVITGVGDFGVKMLVNDLVYFLPTNTDQLKHHLHPAQVWALTQVQQHARSLAMSIHDAKLFVQHLFEQIMAAKSSIQELVLHHVLG